MPLSRAQQAEFRPLVERAWISQSNLVGRNSGDKIARDAWYREQIASATHNRAHSTKDVTVDEYRIIRNRLSMLANNPAQADISISGWTDAQNSRFRSLAKDAWSKSVSRGSGRQFESWLDAELSTCGVHHRSVPGRKESFDQVMAHLAIIAGDMYWIDKTSRAAEDRMRWQILRLLREISEASGLTVGWEYVRGIYSQADLLPADMADAPAQTLWKVFQMLDTHLRRLLQRSATPVQHPCTAVG